MASKSSLSSMMPIFANPAGLWALLGLPLILAIHFLQQRSRVVRTSTWFLIEKLAPDSVRGRTWDRLRSSRTLWLQLLAVLVAAWVLAEPRWVRAESSQTVVLVLDTSVSMDAFRERAIAAAEREMTLADGLAARTTWVVMTTNPRQPALYRGPERLAASAALAAWQPELGRHDLGPALRLARGLAGATGRTLLITDTREKVPADQRAVGVGRPLDNVGFAGASVARDGSGAVTWHALVQNHAGTPQTRTWHVESGTTRTPEESLTLAAGALTDLSAKFPEDTEQITVVLSGDDFAIDDRLPIIRPRPKPLSVFVDGTDETAEFFRKLAASVEGVTVVGPNQTAVLKLARLGATELANERHGGIFWPPADQRAQVPLATDPVTPDRDPLVTGLNWQAWFGTGVYGFTAAPGDDVLLWQGRFPLAFVRPAFTPPATEKVGVTSPRFARKLVLAFDWATSNASRLPATVLLGRRFLEAERDAQPVGYAANFDCGASIALAEAANGALSVEFQPTKGTPAEIRPFSTGLDLRAPGRPGFFKVRRGEEVLVRGAAQFADSRMGDFRAAESFSIELRRERAAALEYNTTPDPFVTGWLALLIALVLGSWWVKRTPALAPPQPTTTASLEAEPTLR